MSKSWTHTRIKASIWTLGGLTVVLGLAQLARFGRHRRPRLRSLHLAKVITVNRPVNEVYEFWRDLENLPRFMSHLESVRVSDGRSHWRVKAPAGLSLEWDAAIIEDRPNEVLSWRTLEGAAVVHTGSVRFLGAPGGRGTEVLVDLQYDIPGGKLGAALAKAFGQDPAEQITDDLRHFKQVMEAGEVVHSDASIRRGSHPARPSKASEVRAPFGTVFAKEVLR
jgi:uncharacterized membrane protein